MTCTGWKDAAFQLQLKVATFQYQAGILTSAALRKYLPLTIEAAFAGAFADLSRNFREKPPTFQSGKAPSKHPQAHIHRLGALTSQAGYQTVASPGFFGAKSTKCCNQRRRTAQQQR